MNDKAVGGQFRLTCGSIGAGKSYINVKLAHEQHEKGRYNKIYSNIRAHAELGEGITELPDDWRDCEEYSLILIDEVQLYGMLSKHFSNRKNDQVADLSMIRHRHCDIWLMSPNPALVNSDVRNLVTQYYYVETTGQKTSTCYCFDDVHNKITKNVKKLAYDEFSYKIEEKYYSMYRSTKDGQASGRTYNLNIKLISFIVGVLFVIALICGLIFYLTKSTKQSTDTMATKAQQASLTDMDCRKGENVTKKECVAYYDRLTKDHASVDVAYDPNKPYDTDAIQKQVTYTVKSKPIFAGCMKSNGRYVAYTQQGTILNQVSQQDCMRLIEHDDRPFNYFKDPEKPMSAVSDTPEAPKKSKEAVTDLSPVTNITKSL